jgi:hypothetical protein
MILELRLDRLITRVLFLVAVLAVCAALLVVVVSNFIVGTLTDERLRPGRDVSRDLLASAVQYFPNSGRLHAKLAAAELLERDRDLARAESHANRAISLSPYNYRFRLTLAEVKEAQGDRPAAEEALRESLKLAPNNADVHWRLANVLLRQGRLIDSLDEFRIATGGDESLLPGSLDLLWRASRGNASVLDRATSDKPQDRLTLARFLLKQTRPDEAARVFGEIDRAWKLASQESGTFINELIAAGALEPARSLWLELKGAGQDSIVLWNGGFESDILRDFAQFDWTITRSEYARFSLDTATAHSGSRSLRTEFIGRDTTRLSTEVRQLVLVRPGARYRLECYAKTSDLVTPAGPRVVVTDSSNTEIAGSAPLAPGSSDWQRLMVDFTAPAKGAVYVTFQRIPKFSYDDPTRGVVWLDDFAITGQ